MMSHHFIFQYEYYLSSSIQPIEQFLSPREKEREKINCIFQQNDKRSFLHSLRHLHIYSSFLLVVHSYIDKMIRIKQDPDTLDLTNHPPGEEEDDLSGEDDTHDCIPKVTQNSFHLRKTTISLFCFRKQHMIAVLLIQVMRIIIVQLW